MSSRIALTWSSGRPAGSWRFPPGFVEGYSKIHHDETRHIGYGVWFLRATVREHPEQGDTVRETLRELRPAVAES